jgi:hypothetical protein
MPLGALLHDQRFPEIRTARRPYVRMTTKHQNLSIGKQMDLIRRFAQRRGLRITKVFSDRFGAGDRRVP